MKIIIIFLVGVFTIFAYSAPPVVFKNSQTAWNVLTKHKNQISRRSAYIFLSSIKKEQEKVWTFALKSNDPVLKRDAILSLFQQKGEAAGEKLLEIKPDSNPIVHETLLIVIRKLNSTKLRKQLVAKMLKPQKSKTTNELYRNNVRLKNDPTYDHEVITVQKISLGKENWLFATDKSNLGLKKKFFTPNLDDKSWKKITVNKNWEVQGFEKYDGYAWYRVSFQAPENKNYNGAEFYFPLVDEEAWIWLNGTYLGQRAEGAAAWSKPFFMDATKEIRWGEINQLTIRVFDSDKAGGICKEPQLHILK